MKNPHALFGNMSPDTITLHDAIKQKHCACSWHCVRGVPGGPFERVAIFGLDSHHVLCVCGMLSLVRCVCVCAWRATVPCCVQRGDFLPADSDSALLFVEAAHCSMCLFRMSLLAQCHLPITHQKKNKPREQQGCPAASPRRLPSHDLRCQSRLAQGSRCRLPV